MDNPTQASSHRPQSIQRAVTCLWLSAGLVVLATGATWVRLLNIPDSVGRSVLVVFGTVTGLLTIALLALVAVKLGAGRAWPRWLFAVVYILGLFLFAVPLIRTPQFFLSLSIVEQASGAVQLGLQTAALVLMFASTSSQWLKDGQSKR